MRHPPWTAAALGVAASIAFPAVALASGGGATLEQTRDAVVVLLVVGCMYLIAHVLVDRLQRIFLFVSGFEYLLLGVLFSQAAPLGIGSPFEHLDSILPVLALAAGWFGLLRGMDLSTDEFRNSPKGAVKLALLDDLLPAAAVGFATYYALRFLVSVSHVRALVVAGFLACAAITGSSSPIDVLKRRYQIEGKVVPLLRRSARLADVGAIAGLGLLLAVCHTPSATANLGNFPPWGWFLVCLGFGAVLGALFTFFLGGDESENGRFLALVGIITFASGAAYVLGIASLTVNLVLGAVLMNFARGGHQIRSTLERTERPMSLILYVCAGALWVPPKDWRIAIVGFGVYVTLRFVAKWVATSLAAVGEGHRRDLFRGLLGQGDVAVAMAVTIRLVYRETDDLLNSAYTVVVASVLFHDLVAPRLLRGLLVDAGQLRREREV